jgi:type IV secretory pathway TrbD component
MAQIERLREILPEKVDWVFEQAKAEGDFRRSETRRVNLFKFIDRMAGIASGFLIGIIGLGVSAYLAMHGHDWVAGVIGGSTVLGLVSVFVIGQVKAPSQRQTNKKP